MVLTGDSMLAGDVGRPGFGGGDAADQYESMSRLLRPPDWAAVFTGHFEGPCGKGMCGRPSSTIGFERLFSSLTRLERPAFIASLTESVPARPFNMGPRSKRRIAAASITAGPCSPKSHQLQSWI